MENKKSKITVLTVILLIVIIILGITAIGMYKKVSEENKNMLSQNKETANQEEMVKELIDTFYFMGDDIIPPSFKNINSVEEDWLWLAAYHNLFSDEQDPGMYVTKEQVEDSAKEIFGENLYKEFPTEGLEFWLEPEEGKYFVGRAGLDPDYINDFEIIDIITADDEVIVEIAEYKYNVLRDDTILKIMNIENNEIVKTLNKEAYSNTDPELFDSIRLYEETIPDIVRDNIAQFSTAKLTIKMNKQTGKMYIVAVERNEQEDSTQLDKNIVLYNGVEITTKTGLQEVDDMKINAEANNKYNTTYYNYENGKYEGITTGKFGEETYEGYSIVSNVKKIAMTQKYNAIPRNYTTIDELPEQLIDMADYSSVDIHAIDLDNDGKTEYIVCCTANYKEGDIGDGEPEAFSEIMLLDYNYKKIANIITLENGFWGNVKEENYKVFLSLNDVEYIDIDNDDIMEMIIKVPTYDGQQISILKYNKGNIEGEVNYKASVLP